MQSPSMIMSLLRVLTNLNRAKNGVLYNISIVQRRNRVNEAVIGGFYIELCMHRDILYHCVSIYR